MKKENTSVRLSEIIVILPRLSNSIAVIQPSPNLTVNKKKQKTNKK
jgi:hypothetical protein